MVDLAYGLAVQHKLGVAETLYKRVLVDSEK